MSRIPARFAKLKKEGRVGLITFTMGFDPDEKASLALFIALPAAGVDIIEIGMPFSDPMADGPIIQQAGRRALANGATLAGILAQVAEFRKTDQETPIVLMGYYNPIYRYGVEKFVRDAKKAGVDGLIVADVPPEEAAEIVSHMAKADIDFIRLITPATGESRMKLIAENASGFLYYVTVAGITGGKSADEDSLKKNIAAIRKYSNLPIAVGFGIKTAEQAAKAAKAADAIIVGSALVDVLATKGPDAALGFIKELSKAIKG